MDVKTIKELNQKIWYRLLKVIYILSFVFTIYTALVSINESTSSTIFLFVLICIGFEIVRRMFFYIILGTISPSDDTWFVKFKRYKLFIIIIAVVLFTAFIYANEKENQISKESWLKEPIQPREELPSLPKLPRTRIGILPAK